MAYESPEVFSASSTSALPRKYSNGECRDGLVMLTCTMRRTPASRAAVNRFLVFATACASVNHR